MRSANSRPLTSILRNNSGPSWRPAGRRAALRGRDGERERECVCGDYRLKAVTRLGSGELSGVVRGGWSSSQSIR